MSKDFQLSQELRAVEDRYLVLAEDKLFFARQMSLRWQEQVAELERQATRKANRTPSGTFRPVLEALGIPAPPDHSRAETEAKNPRALLELARELDEEHRDTPIVPDPRREP